MRTIQWALDEIYKHFKKQSIHPNVVNKAIIVGMFIQGNAEFKKNLVIHTPSDRSGN